VIWLRLKESGAQVERKTRREGKTIGNAKEIYYEATRLLGGGVYVENGDSGKRKIVTSIDNGNKKKRSMSNVTF